VAADAVTTDIIAAGMRAHVAQRLADVVADHGVRLLLAVESGSRAWGFGSPDSDYDVRFVYARPREWYLRLADGRDVIEEGIDAQLVDLSGWDVKKALRLLLKSNPVLYEWLVSPIVYADDGAFRPAAHALFERHASPRALAYHYRSIAQGQWRREVADREQVRLKKYFYVVRPLLSLAHVARHGTPPPMDITALLAAATLPGDVRATIESLLARKRTTPELGLGARLPVLDQWALEQLEAADPARLDLAAGHPDDTVAAADRLFQATVDARDR
jgi:hypothetical protein